MKKKLFLFTALGIFTSYKYILHRTQPNRPNFENLHTINEFKSFSSYLASNYSNEHIIHLNSNNLNSSSFFSRLHLYRDIIYLRKKFKKIKNILQKEVYHLT